MACVTLKRSLDHDPAAAVSTTKRRRFHCASRGSPQMAAASAAAAAAASGCLTFVPPPAAPADSVSGAAAADSVDFPASRLPPELLSLRLTAEVRRLQRRRLLPTSPPASPSPSSATAVRGKSPDSDAEMTPGGGGGGTCAQCAAAKPASTAAAAAASEPVLFTLSQVQSIAEKLLGEREQQVRSEFQALLSAKLQEQYDAFLRFNHDQIYRMHSGAPMSYVS